MDKKSLPKVSIAALGGTITMTVPSGETGVVPTLTADALVATVPQLSDIAELSVATLSILPGASLTPAVVVEAIDWAKDQVVLGAEGVVIAQGTDTLEETAYLAGLYWDRSQPLIFTGAMRTPNQPSADGPANLIAACRAAVAGESLGRGVFVVMNDEVHAAASVRKEHSTSLGSFESPSIGPVAFVVEGAVRVRSQLPAVRHLGRPQLDPFVPLLETHLGDDGRTLRMIREGGADGVVIGAFGVGHVSSGLAKEVEETATKIPVVLTSRTRAGGTLRATYGFEGSEIDLLSRGATLSGQLDQRKARLLLWGLLAEGATDTNISEDFEAFSGVLQTGQNLQRHH